MLDLLKYTCAFLLFVSNVQGQSGNLDSLIASVNGVQEDTNKVIEMNKLGYQLYRTDQERSMQIATEAFELAKKLDYAKGQSNSLFVIAMTYWVKKDYDNAFKYCDELEQFSRANNVPAGIRNSYTLRAVLFQETEQFQQAFKTHFENVELNKALKDTSGLGVVYSNIGSLYGGRNETELATKYFKLSLEMFRAAKDAMRTAHCACSLGLSEQDTTLRLAFIEEGMQLAEENNFLFIIIDCQYALGNFMLEAREHPEAAIPYFKQSLAGAEMTQNFLRRMTNYIQIGKAALQSNQLDTAEKYFKLGYDLTKSVDDKSNILQSVRGLSQVYEKRKRYEEGFTMLKELADLKDTLYMQEKSKELAEADAKYETSKKEAQIAAQELEIVQQQNSKNRLIIGGLILLTLTAGVFQFLFYKQKQRKKETELALHQQQLEAARLKELDELKSQFFTNISHELRTPLTLIISPLEEALRQLKQVNLEKDLRLAHENSFRLLGLVNEVLDLAKVEAGKLEVESSELALLPFLRRVFYAFQSAAEVKGVQLLFETDLDEKLTIETDVAKLNKILNNLLANALKFTPRGGDIVLKANQANGGLTLQVSDTGKGIEKADLPHIFDRFFQSKTATEGGTGIGLALAKQFSKLIGGTLTAESEIDKGTLFSLHLKDVKTGMMAVPLEETEGVQSAVIDAVPAAQSPILFKNRRPQILIVEDNVEMADYLKSSLSKQYDCTVAHDGEVALDLLNQGTSFDLISSDVMMPNMDGFEFRAKLNENPVWRNIPFILLTARTLESDKLKGFQLGIDDYITKPFSLPELDARISNLLSNKQERDTYADEHPEPDQLSLDDQLLIDAENLVRKKLDDPTFSVEEMAKELGFSPRHLSRVFGRLTGLTPVKFILELRLQEARKLIESGSIATINEVRYEIGIESASYFIKKFTERFGSTPKAYFDKMT